MKRAMKKSVAGILAAATLLSVGAISVFAADTGHGRNYKDTNGDQVCDYAESSCRYVDADNDGVCDHYDSRQRIGQGRGFCGRHNR